MNFKNIILCILGIIFLIVSIPSLGKNFRTSGKVTFLRVNEVGTRYGPANDSLDAEVIIKLNSQKKKSFGFKLRKDHNELVHQGMLDLLRDAFRYQQKVTIVYRIKTDKAGKPVSKHGEIFRVWVSR